MNDADKRAALLNAKLRPFARKVAAAEAIIAETIRTASPAFVAYSGGKDSTALLWLARRIMPDIEARILLWPESELLGNFADNIAAWRALGANIREVHLTRRHWTEKVAGKWEALNDAAPARSVFIGLRAQESAVRRLSLRRFGIFHERGDGRLRVCPLARWSTMDVASVIASNDLPLLDRYEESIDVRTTTRIIARPGLTEQALDEMRRRDPSALTALRQIYPGD